MSASAKPCHGKKVTPKSNRKTTASIFLGILIAIIPKCPFCILAYSSAVGVCCSTGLAPYAPGWTSWISIGLAALTLILLVLNYKGKRTIGAISLVLGGSLLIIVSELVTGEMMHYYIGAGLLVAGVWVNASFLFFYKNWIRPVLDILQTTPKNEMEADR